jgi:hypothetical protein
VTVFIYDFFPVEQPFDRSVQRLLDPSTNCLADAARAAFAPDEGGVLRRGEPRLRSDALVVPVIWAAPGIAAPFDRLDGDLQLAPLEEHRSHLSLSASCAWFEDADRPRLQRVAESRVRTFLALVAGRLEAGEDGPEP